MPALAYRPHYERYGIWLVGPSALLLAEGLIYWARRKASLRLMTPAIGILLASLMLWGFQWYYLETFVRTGGQSHVAFRTGKVEPKLQALTFIESWQPQRPLRIVADGWWSYWPLKYLASGQPGVSIACSTPIEGQVDSAEPDGSNNDAWHVVFADVDGHRGSSAAA